MSLLHGLGRRLLVVILAWVSLSGVLAPVSGAQVPPATVPPATVPSTVVPSTVVPSTVVPSTVVAGGAVTTGDVPGAVVADDAVVEVPGAEGLMLEAVPPLFVEGLVPFELPGEEKMIGEVPSPASSPGVRVGERVAPVRVPGDGVAEVPAVSFGGIGLTGPVRAVEALLDGPVDGRRVRFDGTPFGLLVPAGGAGRGRSVSLTPVEMGLARELSPLAAVTELRFDGFGKSAGPGVAEIVERGDLGPGSGWVFEADPKQLGVVPAEMADRLSVFVWAGCRGSSCLVVQELPTSLDPVSGLLRAELPASLVADLGGLAFPGVGLAGAGLFGQGAGGTSAYTGIAPGVAGAAGTYAASGSGSLLSWQVGTHSGYAESSYGIPVPPSPGPVPAVGVSYSSGSVDGMNSSTNTQSGLVGLGWSLTQPVIRRQTRTCAGGSVDSSGRYTGNPCLMTTDPDTGFMLTMSGVSGRLVKTGAGGAHPRYPGATFVGYELETVNDMRIWKVTAAAAKGTGPGGTDGMRGEWWEVTTGDGTLFVFGRNYAMKPVGALTSTPLAQDRTVDTSVKLGSTQIVPVRVPGMSGTGCNGEVCPIEVAWFLDSTIDTSGNMSVQGYWKDQNYYKSKNLSTNLYLLYDKSVQPWFIDYGLSFGSTIQPGTAPASRFRVQFDYGWRNAANSSSAPVAEWYDTPLDLMCTSTSCGHTSPSFFTHYRLAAISTWAGTSMAHQFGFAATWPATPDGSKKKLWLETIQQFDAAATSFLPPITFGMEMKANRVSALSGVSPMSMPRMKTITNELGGKVTFTYGQPYPPIPGGTASQPCSAGATPTAGYVRLPCNMFPAYDSFTSPSGWVLWNSWVVLSERRDPVHGSNNQYEELTYTYDTPPDWAYTGQWGFGESPWDPWRLSIFERG